MEAIGNDALEAIKKDSARQETADTLTRQPSFNVYPYVFYTPETELAFGAGGIYVFYAGKEADLKPSKVGFGGYYSTLKQYSFGINSSFYLLDNKLFINFPVNYGLIIDKYWGKGDSTLNTGNEQYILSSFSTSLTLEIPPLLFKADRSGLILDYNQSDIRDKKNNEYLIDGETTGSEGGAFFGIGSVLVWDSRDNIFFPNKGTYQYFKVVVYPGLGDFNFAWFELDLRYFKSLKPDHILALNFYLSAVAGDPPFYRMPALGGQNHMRGYFKGRYRDTFYATLQAEYRQFITGRFGFVVFAGLGNVSSELLSYDFNNMKYSLGGGLRFLFNKKERINLRMDIGFGQDGNRGIYFGIEEAF